MIQITMKLDGVVVADVYRKGNIRRVNNNQKLLVNEIKPTLKDGRYLFYIPMYDRFITAKKDSIMIITTKNV